MNMLPMAPEAGTTAIVVGGCGGIGHAYVSALASLGVRVAVVDIERSLKSVALPDGVLQVASDASDPAQLSVAIDAAANRLGGCDTLTYVSGINVALTPAEGLDLLSWQRVQDVNATGAFVAAKTAMPWLRKSKAGNILFVASGLYVKPDAGFAAYAASKGAMVSLMKVLAMEGAPVVRANAVAPGLVDTEFLRGGTGAGAAAAGSPAFTFGAAVGNEKVLQAIPMRRLATADDITGPMLFLTSPAAGYVTGQVLFINGGRYSQ